MEQTLQASHLVKRYGKKRGAARCVPDHRAGGVIYGLIGRNGAEARQRCSASSRRRTPTTRAPSPTGASPCGKTKRPWRTCAFPRAQRPDLVRAEYIQSKGLPAGGVHVLSPVGQSLCRPAGPALRPGREKKICKLSKGMMSMVTICWRWRPGRPSPFWTNRWPGWT